jgi:hypothetical protein
MQQRDKTWVGVLIMVLLLGALAVLFPLLIPKGAMRTFSSDNPGKSGVKAIRDLLAERGMQVQKWEREWDHLPHTKGNVLFIVEPEIRGVDKEEISSLREWAERGNTAVIWSSTGFLLFDEMGFSPIPGGGGPQSVSVAESPDEWLRHIDRLMLPENNRIQSGEDIEAVLTDLRGEILVARKRLGQGQIFYIPEPEMITNRFINREDNLALPLFFASFAEGTLWFDESGPRLAKERTSGEDPAQNLKSWFGDQGIFAAAEACIAFLLWLYVRGKRFAAPRWDTVERFRSQDEFVRAMASLYQVSRLRRDSLEILERSFLRDISRMVGFPFGASRDRLAERISALAGGETGERFRLLMEKIERRKNTRITEKELIRLTQEMEGCRREIRKWKIGP